MEIQTIQNKIYEIRGQRMMLDFNLAKLYQVETRMLKQVVRRNIERFPEDFMFEITKTEYNLPQKQFDITNCDLKRKRRPTLMPFAFTEQRAMLSAVLRNGMAIRVSISMMEIPQCHVRQRPALLRANTIPYRFILEKGMEG